MPQPWVAGTGSKGVLYVKPPSIRRWPASASRGPAGPSSNPMKGSAAADSVTTNSPDTLSMDRRGLGLVADEHGGLLHTGSTTATMRSATTSRRNANKARTPYMSTVPSGVLASAVLLLASFTLIPSVQCNTQPDQRGSSAALMAQRILGLIGPPIYIHYSQRPAHFSLFSFKVLASVCCYHSCCPCMLYICSRTSFRLAATTHPHKALNCKQQVWNHIRLS